MTTTLRACAELVVAAGATLTASMLVFRLALRSVDWALLPASAVSRVRWWSTHGTVALRAGLLAGLLGILVLALG